MNIKRDAFLDIRFASKPRFLSLVFILGFALATSNSFGMPSNTIDTSIKTDTLRPIKSRALTGGRSRASIMRVVMQNLVDIRRNYNKRPSIGGKITVKFAIDEFGKVIFCEVIETTVKDPWLENKMVELIKNWQFGKIDKPGDVTEVVYPFIFSPNTYPHMLLYLLIATGFVVILGLFLTHQN